MNIDEAIEWLEIIKDGFYYKDLQCAIKIEGYGDCEKAIETFINEYNNLKQIEEAHRIENGELRKELEQEKEKNKELEMQLLEKDLYIYGIKENRRIAIEEIQEQYFISKDKIKELLKKYEYKEIEEGIYLYKELKQLLEEE